MKRILAFGLAFLLIFGVLPFSALAEDASPAFVIDGGKAQQGDTVQVTLSTKNNPGIVSLKVKIGYDSSVLSLTAMEGADFEGVTFGPVTKNPATVNWLNSLEPNNTTDGVVAVLTFTVLETAEDGDTQITATYNPNDVFDYNVNNVAFDVVNGVVTVGCIHKETTTVPAKASTCLEQGNGEYTYCNRCKQVINGSDELLPLGDHNFTAQMVADQYKVSDATCMEKAVYYHSCTLCGETGETTFTAGDVDANNHSGETITVPAKESTCLAQGNNQYRYCEDCKGVVEGSDALLPFGDHTFTAQVVADKYKVSDATCVDKAVYYHSCTLCGETGETTFTVGDVDANHHSGTIVVVPAKASTCLEQGNNQYSYCEDCKAVVEGSDELLPFGDHKMDAMVERDEYLKSPAMCNTVAIYYYSCSLCGEKGDKTFAGSGTIDRSNHEGNEVLNNQQDPTYDAPGYTGDIICDACGTVLVPGQEIPQLQKPSGLVQDGDVYRYLIDNEPQFGWFEIDGEWYYFFEDTLCAKEGSYKIGVVTYEFENTGKLVSGVWGKTLFGTRYYYGPDYYRNGWLEINGNSYYFQNGYRYEGIRMVQDGTLRWFDFGTDGICSGNPVADGFYIDANGYGYCQDGVALVGTQSIDGFYYYFNNKGYAMKNGTYEGRLYQDEYTAYSGGLVKNGVNYLYKDGKAAPTGLYKIDDDYYYVGWDGSMQTNGRYYTDATFCDLPIGSYTFGSDGKMLQGIVETDGVKYYYINGNTGVYGLYQIEGSYYFVDWGGIIKVDGRYYASTTYCDLPAGNYTFDAQGKMIHGIAQVDGKQYLYVNGTTSTYGLYKVDGDYYFVEWGGIIQTDGRYYVVTTHCDLPANQNYSFGADGKMLNGVVDMDGTLYYYVNGSTSTYGLFNIDGDYYLAEWGGVIQTNGRYYVSTTYCDLPAGQNYSFGADGKMLNGVVDVNGTLYYYINGSTSVYGLFNIDGDYYLADWGGVIRTSGRHYIETSYCDLPAGQNYSFGADGKMLNGIVDVDGTLYYYVNGSTSVYGLFNIDGAYYFADWGGIIRTSGTYYVEATYCDLPAGEYTFGADGKMLQGFVDDGDTTYYYVNGRKPAPGIIEVDGDYYFVSWNGVIIKNQTFYVFNGNGYTVEMNYTFDENGKIIG